MRLWHASWTACTDSQPSSVRTHESMLVGKQIVLCASRHAASRRAWRPDMRFRSCSIRTGDVNGDNGFSPFPGNINQIVLQMRPYVAHLGKTRGIVEEFVNPKYADAEKTTFKKPTRLECMMQDYPKSLAKEEVCGFTTFLEVRHRGF